MTVRAKDVQVGQLIVRANRIVEPLSGCCVARGFPTELHAASAAKELDALADWYGVVKVRASGRDPNCRAEIERIAKEYGGHIADRGSGLGEDACAKVVGTRETNTH